MGSTATTKTIETVELSTYGASKDCVQQSCRPKLIKQKQSITDDEEIYHQHVTICDDIKSQFLRKQSSLNEELMAESRIREKERIRKKIQKQVSLNESFLYRSIFSRRLQVIREGFTTRFKKSTGSLERLTKNGLVKIMKNVRPVNNSTHLGSNNPFSRSESKEPIFTNHSVLKTSHYAHSSSERTSRSLKKGTTIKN